MIDLAKQLKNDTNMISLTQIFVQQPRNTVGGPRSLSDGAKANGTDTANDGGVMEQEETYLPLAQTHLPSMPPLLPQTQALTVPPVPIKLLAMAQRPPIVPPLAVISNSRTVKTLRSSMPVSRV
jgi:hypothetical protein